MAFVLAACAEMLYRDLPLLDRVRTIHEQGFAVEIWDWTTKDLPALAATGAHVHVDDGVCRGVAHGPRRRRRAARAPPSARSRRHARWALRT